MSCWLVVNWVCHSSELIDWLIDWLIELRLNVFLDTEYLHFVDAVPSQSVGKYSWRQWVDAVCVQSWTRRRAATMDTSGINLASMSPHVVPPLFHSLSVGSPPGSVAGLGLGSAPSTPLSAALSPRSLALYSSEDTVESVIGRFGRCSFNDEKKNIYCG